MIPTSVAETAALLAAGGYVADQALATTVHLSLAMRRPLFLEGEPGTGKTEIAKVLAAGLKRRLVRLQPTPVLVFSQHSEAIYATRALESGARGFVSKNATPEELLDAIDAVIGGGLAVEKAISAEMAVHDLVDDAYLRPLTERDLEILRLLAAGHSLAEISKRLGIAYKTVANTLSRIKDKLGVSQTADLIRIAIGQGIT